MQTSMNSETLQALRSEIEAITTLQLALNRIALSVDGESLSTWDGPRPEDVDDVAADDGSFSREAVLDLRRKAGESLSRRYVEVERVIMGRAALESLTRTVLGTGTGGVITQEGPPPGEVLSALARSGAIRLDWAQEAAAQVRDVLEARTEAPQPSKAVRPNAAKAKVKPAKKPAAKPVKKAAEKPAKKAVSKLAKKTKPVRQAVKAVVKAAVSAAVKKVKSAGKKKPAAKPAKKK